MDVYFDIDDFHFYLSGVIVHDRSKSRRRAWYDKQANCPAKLLLYKYVYSEMIEYYTHKKYVRKNIPPSKHAEFKR